MVIALGIIAVLILLSVISLQKFMRDMAIAERDLLAELKEMKNYLMKMSEKQL